MTSHERRGEDIRGGGLRLCAAPLAKGARVLQAHHLRPCQAGDPQDPARWRDIQKHAESQPPALVPRGNGAIFKGDRGFPERQPVRGTSLGATQVSVTGPFTRLTLLT